MHYGHTFCKCFFQGKWILVDPTSNNVNEDYNLRIIKLNYDIMPGANEYIPYLRNVDMGKKMTTIELIELQEEYSQKL